MHISTTSMCFCIEFSYIKYKKLIQNYKINEQKIICKYLLIQNKLKKKQIHENG